MSELTKIVDSQASTAAALAKIATDDIDKLLAKRDMPRDVSDAAKAIRDKIQAAVAELKQRIEALRAIANRPRPDNELPPPTEPPNPDQTLPPTEPPTTTPPPEPKPV